MTVKDATQSEHLHHTTVRDLGKLYMAEQLRLNPMPTTHPIGVIEIAHCLGHEYRVVVSHLVRQRQHLRYETRGFTPIKK